VTKVKTRRLDPYTAARRLLTSKSKMSIESQH